MEELKFNRLALADRMNIVWCKGRFVDSAMLNNYCLMLYSINHQFVELCIDLPSNSVVWVNMASEYDLAKYLENIDIDVLSL